MLEKAKAKNEAKPKPVMPTIPESPNASVEGLEGRVDRMERTMNDQRDLLTRMLLLMQQNATAKSSGSPGN